MASIWEITDPSGLRYDVGLGWGSVNQDQGSGPPSLEDWVRTSWVHTSGTGPVGSPNYGGYTNANPNHQGSTAKLWPGWEDTASPSVNPWVGSLRSCDTSQLVWCVQD